MASGSQTAEDAPGTARHPVVTAVGARAPLACAVVAGAVCVVAGGLVAAIGATRPSEHASWAAAYLVLVAGVAQIGLAAGWAVLFWQASSRRAWLQLSGWNTGNALVIAGTLAGLTALVDLGGVLLLTALLLGMPGLRPPPGGGSAGRRWLLRGYRALVLVLLVSVPVGLLLARRGS